MYNQVSKVEKTHMKTSHPPSSNKLDLEILSLSHHLPTEWIFFIPPISPHPDICLNNPQLINILSKNFSG